MPSLRPLRVEHLEITSDFSSRADYVFDSAQPPADQMGRLQSNYVQWQRRPLDAAFDAGYQVRPLDSGSDIPGGRQGRGLGASARLARFCSAWSSQRLSVDVGARPGLASTCRLSANASALPESLMLDGQLEVGLRLAVDCGQARRPLDVVLAIDRSASMLQGERFEDAKLAARTFIESVDLDVARVALVAVGTEAETLRGLTDDRGALLAAVDALTAEGENNFGKAFDRVRLILRERREDALPAVVLLSDGDTAFPTGLLSDPWLQAAFWAHLEGIRSVVVCVTDSSTCKPEFQQLASPTSHFRVSGGGSDLQSFYRDLALDLGRAELQRLTVSHILTSAFSFDGVAQGQETPNQVEDRLVWQRVEPLFGASELRYRLRADAIGSWPVAERIEASWTDREGGVGQVSVPVPEVRVDGPSTERSLHARRKRASCRAKRAGQGRDPARDHPGRTGLSPRRRGSRGGPGARPQRLDGRRVGSTRSGKAVETMLARPGGNVRFGLVAFSGQILGEMSLTDDRDALLSMLRGLSPAGETNIGQALNRAGVLLDTARAGSPKHRHSGDRWPQQRRPGYDRHCG